MPKNANPFRVQVCREMGAAGQRFVASQLAQRKILDRYAETLESMFRGEIGGLPTWDPFP